MEQHYLLFQTLADHAQNKLDNYLDQWINDQQIQLSTFDTVTDNLLEKLKKTDKKNPFSFWSAANETLENVFIWTQQQHTEPQTISSLLEEYHKQALQIILTFPQNTEITIDPFFWVAAHGEGPFIRVWKYINRRKNNFKNGLLWTQNIPRKLFKKSLRETKLPNKNISVQPFFEYYFTYPFMHFLTEIWQDYLNLLAQQLSDIHKFAEKIAHALFLDEHFEKLMAGDRQPLTDISQNLKPEIPFQERFQKIAARFKKEALEKHTAFISDLKISTVHNWNFAGTFILPQKKYSPVKINHAAKKIDKTIQKFCPAWSEHLQGEINDWHKDIELEKVQLYAGELCHKTITTLSQKIKKEVLPAFHEAQLMIDDALKDFKKNNFLTVETLTEKILAASRTTLRTLRREKFPLLTDCIVNAQFSKSAESYLALLQIKIESLSDEYTIFRFQDIKNIPPESKFIDIPLKDLITEVIFPDFKEEYNLTIDMIDQKINMLIRSVSENDQIIELNFDTALELLRSDSENKLNNGIKVSTEGLQRSANQLQSLAENSKDLIDRTVSNLILQTVQLEKRIQELNDNEKIIALKIRASKAKTQEKIREKGLVIIERFKKALPHLLHVTIGSLKKIRGLYFRVRKITGLSRVSLDIENQLSRFLHQTKNQLLSLPFVYQRLFRFQPLEDERFFAGREIQMDQLKSSFEEWKKEDFAITALVGEKGSGRTTILNFAEKEFYGQLPLIKINLTETIYKENDLFKILSVSFNMTQCNSMDELELEISKSEKNRICIIENLHKTFLRVNDGFRAFERFLLLISNTHSKVHWVVTCGLYSWNYLSAVLNINKYFQNVVFLPELGIENIKNVILKRHRVSGYHLYFEPTEQIEKSRKYNKLSSDQDKQDYLQEDFFKQLNELSSGNITVAILFWLCAIKEMRDDSLVLSPVIEFDPVFMQNMPSEDLFTFAAFLQHETLTASQHAQIFNQDLQKSLLLFNRMKNKGILSETINGYQLHYLLYRPVVRNLVINNILV